MVVVLALVAKLIGCIAAIAVALPALRRIRRSHGFNRVYFGMALAYAVVGLGLVALTGLDAMGMLAGLVALGSSLVWMIVVGEVQSARTGHLA